MLYHCESKMGVDHTCDLTRLPSKMQELFIIGGRFHGVLNLCAIPRQMRIPMIRCAYDTHQLNAFINAKALPESIALVCITNAIKQKQWIQWVGAHSAMDRPASDRVLVGESFDHARVRATINGYSAYVSKLDIKF